MLLDICHENKKKMFWTYAFAYPQPPYSDHIIRATAMHVSTYEYMYVCSYVHCTDHPTDVRVPAMSMCTYGGKSYPEGP